MAKKTKIKKDAYGLYVKGGGYLWRPIHPEYTVDTLFTDGMEVSVNHTMAGPVANINCNGIKESWYSHGAYIEFSNGKSVTIQTEKLFKPSYENWY
jgi:hypothetical protein